MTRHRWLGLAAALLLCVAAALGLARTARASHSRAQAAAHAANAGLDSVSVLAQWGFGQPRNEYAWGMAWFQGKLYVGTGPYEICVEKVTDDFYYPFAHSYVRHPEPGVTCPKNPYDMNLRAEIWQYTPQTRKWVMVYEAPNDIPNPRAPGKFISPDIAYRGMAVVTDPQGRQVLFVSGVSADEYIPELAIPHPPRLLRSYDGVHFQNIVGSSFIEHRTGQFTDVRPMGFRGLVQLKGQLYVVASTSLTGAGEVFRIDNPWGGYAHFTQVSPPSTQVFEIAAFAGHLYMGTGSSTTGYAVLRLLQTHRPYRVQQVVRNGAGRGKYMTSVVAMQVYRNWLYVSAAGWYCLSCNALPAAELIRVAPNGDWQVVAGNPRFIPLQSETKYPISGLDDGFDNIFNAHFWRMAVIGNALYVGTNDWSYLLQKDTSFLGGFPGLLVDLLSGEMGFDIWGTCDGVNFFPVTRNAFGVDYEDFGVRTMVGEDGNAFVGSADHAHGIRVYETTGNACQGFIQPAAKAAGSARAAAARDPAQPQALMTDVQRAGTVLSWEPAARAMRYEVMRATYSDLTAPFSYQSPMALPGGQLFDDDFPIPATPGAPGSNTAELPIAGAYQPIGSTLNTFFVDRNARRGTQYSYQIVAVGASGPQSLGSNVQVVPDPRPAASFAALARLLPSSVSSLAHAARSQGCTGSLAQLRSLARSAATSEARELAARLERRLEYRALAGGPVTGSLTCG